jgi:hypothetical protein
MARGDRRSADSVLILALASGRKVEDAAKLARVSVATVYRRQRDEAFRAEVMNTRREMWTEAVGQLTAACTEAVDALRALLKDPVASARLGAAKTILETSQKGVELLELEQRLAAVEGRLESQQPGRTVRRVG